MRTERQCIGNFSIKNINIKKEMNDGGKDPGWEWIQWVAHNELKWRRDEKPPTCVNNYLLNGD